MTIDLNRVGSDLQALLQAAEANAETDFKVEFCASLRERMSLYGDCTMLTPAQEHKLRCIALAGGFWERGECSI
ncbi:MAG: hypothetical protein AB7S93_26450 [Xanthobacteraceae bacterium]